MTLPGMLASLVWGAPDWLPAALGLAVVAAATLVWAYRRASGTPRLRAAAATLKALGIVTLVALLVDPLWSTTRVRPGENVVLVLVDSSQSMQVRGKGAAPSAGEALRTVAADERRPWLVRVKQDFDVRRYAFGDRLESRGEFETLAFDGRSSSLYAALEAFRGRYSGRPVAGIVLFSDGSATDTPGATGLASLPPIYPVLPPETAPADDVALVAASATQTGFEDAPVTVQAEARRSGFAGESLVCRVLDEAGKVVASQSQAPSKEGAAAFRFQFRPEKEGLSFYRLDVAPASQAAARAAPSTPSGTAASTSAKPAAANSAAPTSPADTANTEGGEATLANNQRFVQVDRGRGPYRILYVGGMPNPEHKFLGRALAEDRQVELVSLIRIARREPKFDFRTRAGETTNPLFRGFDKVDDETERYDQPVFVRLGLKDESELRDGFPKTADKLFAYHALILDDVEAAMFTTDQMNLISRFVSERGGGLLMLGGPDAFEKGGFARTPVADALPVYLERTQAAPAAPPAGGYRWELTREGRLEPWLRLRANEVDEQKRIEEMPPFRTLNRVSGIKPGAQITAAAVDNGGARHPALVIHTYGRGRAAAMLVGDLWRWRLQVDPENQDLEKTWRQLVRRLTADVPGRVAASSTSVVDDRMSAVRIAVRARDREYKPADNAAVEIAVTTPDGRTVNVSAEPSRTEAGLYEATYVPRLPGAYRAAAKVAGGDGEELGRTETGWTNDSAADEFRRLTPDRAALADLAAKTGGETVEVDELDSFAASLAARPAPETVQSLLPLRHTWWIFAFAVVCLSGEWGLRRWRGLP
jgi:uncharacterized membrane protein